MNLKNKNDNNKNSKIIILISAIAVIAILAGVLVGIGLTSFLNNAEDEITSVAGSAPLPDSSVVSEESSDASTESEDEDNDSNSNSDSALEDENATTATSESSEKDEEADKLPEDAEVATKPAAVSDSGKPISEVEALIKPKAVPKEENEAIVSPLSADEKYMLITDDVSALDAMRDCHDRGGHLLYINDYDEYAQVVKYIYDNKADNCVFYLGGYRDEDSKHFYWVDDDKNKVSKAPLNDDKSWCIGAWAEYEPVVDNEDTLFIAMYYNSGEERWVWMSIGNNLPGIAPQYSGRTAYICEFESDKK